MALYAFDGTWNLRDGADVVEYVQSIDGTSRSPFRDTVETNVHRFYEFYGGSDGGEYLQGVGTRFGPIGRVFGGAFGFGGRHRIRKMYRALSKRYHGGDPRIDIVGFSRGSALAVHFANLINEHGVRDPAVRHRAWWYYRDFGLTWRFPKASANQTAPPVGFLGLFDLVATFGWPIGPPRNAGKKWAFDRIPGCVDRAFHAMALDEIRQTFELVRPTIDADRTDNFYEVWFRGAHSNVGGGYIDRGLSDIALAWMMEQAIWTWRRRGDSTPEGFEIALDALQPHGEPDPDYFAGSGREALRPDPDGMIGRTRRVPRKVKRRPVRPNARVHHTATSRSPNLAADHYNLNRSLLRPMPGDRRISYDPPWLFIDTVKDHAERIAQDLFGAVPVRPSWLRVSDDADGFVFRSDDWIGQGGTAGREPSTDAAEDEVATVRGTLRPSFELVATAWVRAGGDIDPDDHRLAEIDVDGCYGLDTVADVVRWTVSILDALIDVMPRTADADFLLSRFDRERRIDDH